MAPAAPTDAGLISPDLKLQIAAVDAILTRDGGQAADAFIERLTELLRPDGVRATVVVRQRVAVGPVRIVALLNRHQSQPRECRGLVLGALAPGP